MSGPTAARRGEILPGFTLPDVEGNLVSLDSSRGRTNLVIVFSGGSLAESRVATLLGELAVQADALAFEAAQVLAVVSSRPDAVSQRDQWRFPVLVDEGACIHRSVGAADSAGGPAPAVFVADRFREIYAAYQPGRGSTLPGAKEILDWLVFINIQCPECSIPEWPT